MSDYDDELYAEMCQDDGIQYDNEEVKEELIKDLEISCFDCYFKKQEWQ